MRQRHTGRTLRQRGMTLVEIMVVLVILGMIAGAVVVSVIPAMDRARVDRAGLDIRAMESALKLYYAKHGRYPDTAAGLGVLQVETTLDPWGNPYQYLNEQGRPLITSYGNDGQPGGTENAGDIHNRQAPPS